jgi:hypothetical protein
VCLTDCALSARDNQPGRCSNAASSCWRQEGLASTIYTIIFAYAGTALTVLLVLFLNG